MGDEFVSQLLTLWKMQLHVCWTAENMMWFKNRNYPSSTQQSTQTWMKVNGRCEMSNYHMWFPLGQTPTWRCFVWSHVPFAECNFQTDARAAGTGRALKDLGQQFFKDTHSSQIIWSRYNPALSHIYLTWQIKPRFDHWSLVQNKEEDNNHACSNSICQSDRVCKISWKIQKCLMWMGFT